MQERYRVCPQANKAMEDTNSDFHCLCYDETEAEKLTELLNNEETHNRETYRSLIEYAAFVMMIEEYTDGPIVQAIWDAGKFKKNRDFNDAIAEFRSKAMDKFSDLKR